MFKRLGLHIDNRFRQPHIRQIITVIKGSVFNIRQALGRGESCQGASGKGKLPYGPDSLRQAQRPETRAAVIRLIRHRPAVHYRKLRKTARQIIHQVRHGNGIHLKVSAPVINPKLRIVRKDKGAVPHDRGRAHLLSVIRGRRGRLRYNRLRRAHRRVRRVKPGHILILRHFLLVLIKPLRIFFRRTSLRTVNLQLITIFKSRLMYVYGLRRNGDGLHIYTVRKGIDPYGGHVLWNRHLPQSRAARKGIIPNLLKPCPQRYGVKIPAPPEGIGLDSLDRIGNNHLLDICVLFKGILGYNLDRVGDRHILFKAAVL